MLSRRLAAFAYRALTCALTAVPRLRGAAICAAALALSPPVFAQSAPGRPIDVDLELVLMADVSRSMTPRELEIQRQGYAAALQTEAVFAAVQSGLLQRVAMTYVEWAGTQQVVVAWRLLESRADLAAFADTLTAEFNPSLRRTSISEALVFGAHLIETNDYEGLRKVIDISGDGPNNQGRQVTMGRDLVTGSGITINGLPLMTREGRGMQWHLDDLDLYYQSCVIGGPGAFVIPVYDWEDFAEAVRRKLVLEIAAVPPTGPVLRHPPKGAPLPVRAPQPATQPVPLAGQLTAPAAFTAGTGRAPVTSVQFAARNPRDCQVGEKMWRDIRRGWGNDYLP